MILLAFLLSLSITGFVLVLGICQAAAAGDKAMNEFFAEEQNP